MVRSRSCRFVGVCLLGAGGVAVAQPNDPSGIEFVTIGAVGNRPWQGNGQAGDTAIGRGGVNYEYKIGKYEVTTAQWVEFFNAAFDRPANDRIPQVQAPNFWGASGTTPQTPGGQRWRVPTGNEMRPTGNISWRTAAIYCNWLHNDKRTDRDAFLSGAYDVSTFGYIFGDVFTDQQRHSPGAKYWIPTWDEWLKAAHYDPNKLNGDGSIGGWWNYSNGTDQPMVGGPPGVSVGGVPAQANFGWNDVMFPPFSPFAVPLGAYPQTQSPWGLFDVAGATSEWTEEVLFGLNMQALGRLNDGSYWSSSRGFEASDSVRGWQSEFPSGAFLSFGLRVAAVPSPGPIAVIVFACGLGAARRRRS